MSNYILIIDDDASICEILTYNLKSEGYIVEVAHSAEEAIKKEYKKFDILLLDVMMGGMSGFKFLEKIRSEGFSNPVIFLTAKDTENDLLTGFSIGADDYITKPFSIKEIIARIKVLLKRTKNNQTEKEHLQKIKINNLEINLINKEVSINNQIINLTKTEFEILIKLTEYPNRTLSRNEIIERVWGNDTFITERTVDVHITRLRKKLDTYGAAIINRLGFGYKFDITKI